MLIFTNGHPWICTEDGTQEENMLKQKYDGTSTYSGSYINEVLERHDDYILALARAVVPRHITSPELLGMVQNHVTLVNSQAARAE
jgi:hypothetical protein